MGIGIELAGAAGIAELMQMGPYRDKDGHDTDIGKMVGYDKTQVLVDRIDGNTVETGDDMCEDNILLPAGESMMIQCGDRILVILVERNKEDIAV